MALNRAILLYIDNTITGGIIIKESQLIKLMETAMDLDIYVQPKNFSASNGNEDLEGTIEDSIQKLQELLIMKIPSKAISIN